MSASSLLTDKSTLARLLLITYLAPWMVDTRADASTHWLLYLQLAGLVVSIVSVWLVARIFVDRKVVMLFYENRFNISVVSLFIIVSAVSGIVFGNKLYLVLANEIPIVLFVCSIVMISIFAQAGVRLIDVAPTVMALATTSIFFKFVFAMLVFKLDINTVRYQILSGCSALGAAYLIARVSSGYRLRHLLSALGQTFIILISVTRSLLLVVGMMVLTWIAANWRRLLRAKTMLVGLFACAAFVGILLVGFSIEGNNPLARWSGRLGGNNTVDASGLDRVSQTLYQIDRLNHAGPEKLIGFGLAAEGGNSIDVEVYLQTMAGPGELYRPIGWADSTYVSMIFLGGIIGGGPLLLWQFVWAWKAFVTSFGVAAHLPKRLLWLAAAPLSIIGAIVANVFSASYADRTASIYLGCCVALTYWIDMERRWMLAQDQRMGERGSK